MTRAAYVLGAALAWAAIGVATGAGASQASIANARTETRSAARGLAAEITSIVDGGATLWIGYQVPLVPPRTESRSSNGRCCGQCRLAPPTELLVLVRVADRALAELRASVVDCDVDAGGMTLVWLNDVRPDDSVAWLASLLAKAPSATSPPSAVARGALTAVALHAAPSAPAALITIARADSRPELRGQALFWLAQRAAAEARPAIAEAIERDPDIDVKTRAVFALSNLPSDESVPLLIELARTNRNTEVRRQAMFWLGQKKDPRALAFFEQVLLK